MCIPNGIFEFMVFINLLSLIPRSSVSGIVSVIFVTMLVWVSIKLLVSVSDFVPARSPFVLSPFLLVIEIISLLVRPVAIVLRFCINMLCRHLLLVVFPPMIILPLEVIVCVVQGYVLILLMNI